MTKKHHRTDCDLKTANTGGSLAGGSMSHAMRRVIIDPAIEA
jgi:hypothetical protein